MANPMPPQEESGFQKRTLGLPMWGWVAITGAVAVVGIVWWRSRKSAAASPATTVTAPGTMDTSGLATDQYEALLAQLRNLQGPGSNPNPGGAVPNGASLAVRNEQKDNMDSIRINASENSWLEVLNNHYTNLPGNDPHSPARNTLAWILAHENGQSGSVNPHGKAIGLPYVLAYPAAS